MTKAAMLTLLLLLAGCSQSPPPAPALRLADVLGGSDTAGFLRADAPRTFAFPADHGPHAGFRNEWWYFTGNLRTDDGRRFGYQLTFFTAAQPAPAIIDSDWAGSTIWMAHLALTDVNAGRHQAFERFSRQNPGLAGAAAEPFHVWLDDWQVREVADGWQLQAAEQGIAIDLLLQPLKPPVLQGDAGLSRKSTTPGNASYYYSMTRLLTQGSVIVDNINYGVEGLSWLDREWSTSALDANQVGWDWFSLQFDDGTELMVYQLRERNGDVDPISEGSWTAVDGTQQRLNAAAFALEPLTWWTGPDGVDYAVRWRLQHRGSTYVVEALLDAQFLPLSLPYWEGAVQVRHEQSGAIAGSGYVEMVRQ